MKICLSLAFFALSAASVEAQPVVAAPPVAQGTPGSFPGTSFSTPDGDQKKTEAFLTSLPEDLDPAFGQDKPKKTGKAKEQDTPKNQEVKEVATARRQGKPEKVSSDAGREVGVMKSAARPQSAARPGRGAAAGAVKAAGNATKAVKAGKPIKVGGVGVGRIKVGKN